MNSLTKTCKLLALMLLLSPQTGKASDASPIQWRTDFEQAAIEAQKQNKLLVISIHSKTCAPCKAMQKTTFQDPKLAAVLNENCIPLSIDGEENPALLRQWRINSFPTQMMIAPTGPLRGRVLDRLEAKVGAADYLAHLQKAMGQLPKSPQADNNIVPVSATKMDRPATNGDPLPPKNSPIKPLAKENPAPTTGLEGFCPVSMIERGQMVVGDKGISRIHNGVRYNFVNQDNAKAFDKDPEKYLPGNAGNCVVTEAEVGSRIPGKLKYPALFNGVVFFFADEAKQTKFLADPDKYVNKTGKIKPSR